MWLNCIYSNKKWGSITTVSIPLSSCLLCELVCPNKSMIVEQLLNEETTLEELKSKGRLISVRNMWPCPLKPSKECFANRKYCKYNSICTNLRFKGRTKLLRWRKTMKYGIKYKNTEEINICDKDYVSELRGEELSQIEKVYKITHALTPTVELLPNTDEGAEIEESLKLLINKFGTSILDSVGEEVDLSKWFSDCELGDVGYVFTEELQPVKTVKAVPINKVYKEEEVEVKKTKKSTKKKESKPFNPEFPDSTPEAPYGYTKEGVPRQRRPRRSSEEMKAMGKSRSSK